MKSPLSRGSDAPHVHQRLRKHLARCTLDCGFKTPESPALRGFVAERAPIRGTFLYLVLKSNGCNHPENRLKKFGFSLKTTSTNIAKKLSAHSLLKSGFFHIFNFAHKCLAFDFTCKSGYTLGFPIKIAHGGSHAETRGFTHDAAWSVSRPLSHLDKEKPEEADARPTACVRFLRRRSPAGLRGLFRFCRNCCLYALYSGFSTLAMFGGITTCGMLHTLSKCSVHRYQNG